MTRGRAGLILLAVSQLTCHQVILTAPLGSTIIVVPNPPFIVANGGISVISARVLEAIGTPVPDDTVVQFFTTLGRIQEQGKTNDGVARVNLVSDTRSGRATVTAASGAAQATTTVDIGSVLPTRVFVTAEPNRITESRTTHVVANVSDANGNPVPGISVIFTVDGPPSTEFFLSGSAPMFTDSDGRAEDILRTQHPRDAPRKTVTVRATTSNGVTNTTQVTIN